jgi:catechol 2,3-dioxygenase-like lactoylglutathione lyase family enzyme
MIVFDPDGVAVDVLRYTPPPGKEVTDAANRTQGEMPSGTNRTSPVMRVSLLVRDTARSLAVYRDVLGMTVIDERTFGGPEIGKALGLGDCEFRATYLTAEDSSVGVVGLMEVVRGTRPELPAPAPRIHRGQPAMVFSTNENHALFAELKKAGMSFICEPVDFTSSRGTYIEAIFLDPDGIPVSLIQFSPA